MKKLSLEELGRISLEEYLVVAKTPITVVLDNIRSGMNVGSVFRTSDAFLLEEIHLCGITVCPPHKEIMKTAIGAEHTVKFSYFKNIEESILLLKSKGFTILGIEQTDSSVQLNDIQDDLNFPIALVFGNEVNGLSEQIFPLLDGFIEIPQFGTKHSLNVSVCAGIVIWDFWKAYQSSQHKGS